MARSRKGVVVALVLAVSAILLTASFALTRSSAFQRWMYDNVGKEPSCGQAAPLRGAQSLVGTLDVRQGSVAVQQICGDRAYLLIQYGSSDERQAVESLLLKQGCVLADAYVCDGVPVVLRNI